jgi:hypothetical protein
VLVEQPDDHLPPKSALPHGTLLRVTLAESRNPWSELRGADQAGPAGCRKTGARYIGYGVWAGELAELPRRDRG